MRVEKGNCRERKASGLREEEEKVRLPKEMVWSYICLKNHERREEFQGQND